MKEEILEKIRNCIVNIDVKSIRSLVKEALAAGIPAYEVLMKGMAEGMDVVGQKYEAKEYFLSELLGAGEIMKEGIAELTPHLQVEKIKHVGKVVIGTVRGDIHDIGKNIVVMLLTSAGFEVYDLGVDVPPERFAEKVKETDADIVAISAMLTMTMGEMKTVIEELKKASSREKVKVIIGGAPITNEYAQEIGADAAGMDAAHGVRICKQWMSGGLLQ